MRYLRAFDLPSNRAWACLITVFRESGTLQLSFAISATDPPSETVVLMGIPEGMEGNYVSEILARTGRQIDGGFEISLEI